MGSKIFLGGLFVILALSIVYFFWAWTLPADADISPAGWVAMLVGIIATAVVGCGLMALVFISHRRGYDEPAQRDLDQEQQSADPADSDSKSD